MSDKKPVDMVEAEVLPARRGPGRPPKVLEIVGDKTLPERADQIRVYHQSAMTAAAQTAMYAILCGMELLAARAQIAHGRWEQWVMENCPFAPVTAWRYMQAAQNKMKDIPNLSARKDLLLTAPHLLAEKDRKLLVDSVKDAVDGQSWMDLQLELGLRMPPKDKGGAREGAGRPRTSDFSEERKTSIRQQYKFMLDNLTKAILVSKTWQYLDPKDLCILDEAFQTFREELKPAIQAARGR